ncbi:MAG: hypothetical protein IPK33_25525 [Gemmatimonadetes bacterium]|nr:hypothetical protein [Gemmatimonadota bacterium]
MGSVISQAVGTILTWVARPERFAWPRRDSLAGALSFSSHVLISRLAWYLYSNADFAVAGLVLRQRPVLGRTLAAVREHPDRQDQRDDRARDAGLLRGGAGRRPDDAGILLQHHRGARLPHVAGDIRAGAGGTRVRATHPGPEWSAAIVPLQLLSIYASYRSLVTVLPQVLTVKGRHQVDDVAGRLDGDRSPDRISHRQPRWTGRHCSGVDHRLPTLHDATLPPDLCGDRADAGAVPQGAVAVATRRWR